MTLRWQLEQRGWLLLFQSSVAACREWARSAWAGLMGCQGATARAGFGVTQV
jgi:hypothetical protein